MVPQDFGPTYHNPPAIRLSLAREEGPTSARSSLMDLKQTDRK